MSLTKHAKLNAWIEEIKAMTVLELNELVKAIEEEFGVSAATPKNLLDYGIDMIGFDMLN